VIGFAERGVRSSVVRVPPITHSTLDRHGFARTLIAIARQTGVAGYPGDGANRWAAGHTLDVAHLYRLALEDAPAGTRWHAAGDEGIPVREIAQSIGDHLGLPAESIPEDRLQQHFGFLATVIVLDNPTSTAVTRRILGWAPTHPGLLADFDHGDYFLQGREPLPPRRPRGRPVQLLARKLVGRAPRPPVPLPARSRRLRHHPHGPAERGHPLAPRRGHVVTHVHEPGRPRQRLYRRPRRVVHVHEVGGQAAAAGQARPWVQPPRPDRLPQRSLQRPPHEPGRLVDAEMQV
jgi:hypothetical protein